MSLSDLMAYVPEGWLSALLGWTAGGSVTRGKAQIKIIVVEFRYLLELKRT